MAHEQVPPMFEPDAESMPPERLADLQQERLRGLVDRLLAAGGVQAGRLGDAGVTSGAGVTFGDLNRLPMTGKADLWGGYPFGMFAVPLSDVVTLHGSSGTGGRPTLVGYTRADLRLWGRLFGPPLAPARARPAPIAAHGHRHRPVTRRRGNHQRGARPG